MRIFMPAALAAALLLCGCGKVASLRPFISESAAVPDGRICGVWSNAEQDQYYIVKPDGAGYRLTYITKDMESAVTFKVRAMKVDDALLVDFTPADAGVAIPGHTAARIWPEGGVARIALLDSAWFREQVKQRLQTQESDGPLVITAPPEQVQEFLKKYGADERAYGDPQTVLRVQ